MDKYGKATPEALVESAVWEAGLFEEHDFHDFKISVKHNDPVVMVRAYELLAEAGDWPLHLGVTEAGPAFQGTIKSGDRVRRTCSARASATPSASRCPPRRSRRSRSASRSCSRSTSSPRKLEIVSCPSCGRAQVDVYKLAEEVTAGLDGLEVPLRVAVMGCVVNGPGEAREADLGVASGNGKGQIFVKGEVIKTVPESQIVETLIEEAMRIAEGMEAVDGAEAVGQRLADAVQVRRRFGGLSGTVTGRLIGSPVSTSRHGVRVLGDSRPRRLPGPGQPGPGRQRLRRSTGRAPPASSRAGWAGRSGDASRRRAGGGLPRRSQPGAGPGQRRRRARVRRAGADPQPDRHRRSSGRTSPSGVLERRRRVVGPAPRDRAGANPTW